MDIEKMKKIVKWEWDGEWVIFEDEKGNEVDRVDRDVVVEEWLEKVYG